MGIGNALKENAAWGKTENGADTYLTTCNKCLDLFGMGGALRGADEDRVVSLFSKAYAENPDLAMKLLFYIRDVMNGYGERDVFQYIAKWLGNNHMESITKNLWAFMSFGRAKDLYCLRGTQAEDAMWQFMREQFEHDLREMNKGNQVSLLAKWIATPDASSKSTAELGKLTAKKLGYSFKTMSVYKKKLRSLRAYIDVTERKMCANKWKEIKYPNVPSLCMLKNSDVFAKHDPEGYERYIEMVKAGRVNINTGTLNPVDIIRKIHNCYNQQEIDTLTTMWENLKDTNSGNVLVMCDVSGSMTCGMGTIQPIIVALAMTLYLSERNKGDLKNLFMTFSEKPKIQEICGSTLSERLENLENADWGYNTNLEAAFHELLHVMISKNIPAEEMPEALVIVSDMQIDKATDASEAADAKFSFYERMKSRYEANGYKLPHLVFWNVNAKTPSFLAKGDQLGVSFVSGYSANIFKQVIESIGSTPTELMLKALNNDRYKNIKA